MALWDNAACMEIDRLLASRGIRYSAPTLGTTIGNPPGRGHTKGSNHYREQDGGPRGSTGQARDHGTYGSDCNAIAEALEPYARGPNYVISELIWTRRLPRTGIYYKRGIAYKPSLLLAWQHRDHVHDAIGVGRHFPDSAFGRIGPKPQPVPVPIPPEEDMSIKDTMFVRGDKSAEVYLIGNGPPRLVTSQSALANQSHLGFGRAPIPSDVRTEVNNGVKVAVLDQGAMNELL